MLEFPKRFSPVFFRMRFFVQLIILFQLEGMPSTWIYIIVNLVVYVIASSENEQTKAFIQLTEFDYEDNCASTAEAEWAFINSPSNKTLSAWVSFSLNKFHDIKDKNK